MILAAIRRIAGRSRKGLFMVFFGFCPCLSVWAQDADERANPQGIRFGFDPPELRLEVGDTAAVRVEVLDASGNRQKVSIFLFSRRGNAGRALTVTPRRGDATGTLASEVVAFRPGSFTLIAGASVDGQQFRSQIPVEISNPPLARIVFDNPPAHVYAGTIVSYRTRVYDRADFVRHDIPVRLGSSDSDIATFDDYGHLTAIKPGRITLTAQARDIKAVHHVEIKPNPITQVRLSGDKTEARTGDVIHFQAQVLDRRGNPVADAPLEFSVSATPDDNLGQPASGLIEQDGRFVAETPGLYTIRVNAGQHSARAMVRITARNVQKRVALVGHGPVEKVFTSDLWVWQGIDGRDYAVTGTWGANGEAYFWDVTNPAKMTIIDTVTVDARTVNDVKVAENGRIAVISREGASSRRNGIVILDVSNPFDVEIIAEYDDELTGGVHNVFIYENHIYAVNNGQRFDVINIDDPRKPYRVSRFELSTPGHSIHDVWIEDGIAYSSNWGDGIQLIDVGAAPKGGPFQKYEETPMPELQSPFFAGGSPSNPKQFASYTYPSGWNHAAFPYHSESTGKFYVLGGDEAFPYGDNYAERKPTIAAGWIHFVDFTNPQEPREVARYQVPEAGSHNFWVEGDILYAAFYNGGLRVVDISGELMGDLYRQGREIAWYLPFHGKGLIPNSPMVWGPQPYKGLIFFSDYDSGLWAVRLVTEESSDR